MSRGAYGRSSFDAIESTRRLSDELTKKDNNSTLQNPSGRLELEQDIYESCYSDIENETEREADADQKYNSLNSDNEQNEYLRKESSASNDVGFTSSSLGSFAKESSSDPNDEKLQGENNNVINEDDEEYEYDDEDDNDVRKVEQRSESDSDLESPDDFDGNDHVYTRYKSFDVTTDDQGIENTHQDEIRNTTKDHMQTLTADNIVNSDNNIDPKIHSDKSPKHDFDISESETSNFESNQTNQSKFSEQESDGKGNSTENVENEVLQGSDSKTNKSYSNDEANDKCIDVYSKFNDKDVIDHTEKLDTVKDIGFGNMGQLQNLDRNDPALRRLFMRPRVSPAEAKSVKVDPDIKGMVNEFLRTNVAENFIIARVLRENYALFYSWLASHIQTERNSWAVRLSQAFENADQERKGSLESRNLVMESAARLQTIARTVSNSLYGFPDAKSEKALFRKKGPSLRHGNVKAFRTVNAGGGGAKRAGNSDSNTTHNSNKNTQSQKANNLGTATKQPTYSSNSQVLRPSSFNMIEVSELITNYESDPGIGRTNYGVRKRAMNMHSSRDKTQTFTKQAGNLLENKKVDLSNKNGPNIDMGSKSINPGADPDTDTMPFGYTINGIVVEYENDTNWNEALTESIDVMVEICDTFLTDRKACMKLISAKSSQFESLVDALSSFIQDNQTRDYIKRKEIEKRLKVIEMENSNMQEEMNLLKKTLLDKNEDALNLQSQLNSLESAVKSKKAVKVDKCVGTQDTYLLSKIADNLAVTAGGKASKSKTPNLKGEVNRDRHRGNNHKTIHKLSKSPYAAKETIIVNGPETSKDSHNKNGYASDRSETAINICQGYSDKTSVDQRKSSANKDNNAESNDTGPVAEPRQQTFIEISEEKLEKLKHRAKKLENSLHDAISSMDTLNKSTPWLDKVRHTMEKPMPMAHIHKVKTSGNHHQTAKNIAYWKKSSFEITSSLSNRHRLAGIITAPSLEINKKKEQSNSDLTTDFVSEQSGFLEGRSIPVPYLDITNARTSNNMSGLTLATDRSQGLTPGFDGYHSDDDDRMSIKRQQINENKNDLSARSEISHKVRARRGQVKQIVSKCLRCQKLFSPTDNHKLACCYHTKDKERLEHYDHMGMLVKVIHAWKCCNQPQEADGCCFGKHV